MENIMKLKEKISATVTEEKKAKVEKMKNLQKDLDSMNFAKAAKIIALLQITCGVIIYALCIMALVLLMISVSYNNGGHINGLKGTSEKYQKVFPLLNAAIGLYGIENSVKLLAAVLLLKATQVGVSTSHALKYIFYWQTITLIFLIFDGVLDIVSFNWLSLVIMLVSRTVLFYIVEKFKRNLEMKYLAVVAANGSRLKNVPEVNVSNGSGLNEGMDLQIVIPNDSKPYDAGKGQNNGQGATPK